MQPIETQKSLVDQVYEAILDAISDGTLKPGERLNQNDLADRLNVSRQPLNIALARLKSEGFVETAGRRGVTVAQVDRDLADSIYEYRTAVDPLAVTLATAKINGKAVAEAKKIIETGRKMVKAGNTAGAVKADADFHSWIYQHSENPVLTSTMDLYWRHLQRSMIELVSLPDFASNLWDQHEEILHKMISGDATDAADAMRNHLEKARKQRTCT